MAISKVGPFLLGTYLGERRKAVDIGFLGGHYLWRACIECRMEKWVQDSSRSAVNYRCQSCAHFRTGRKIQDGYVLIWVYQTDWRAPMARTKGPRSGGYIFEHRLIMANSLERNLESWECVHHKNGIKDDNRLENLELVERGSHAVQHGRGYVDGYEAGYQDGVNRRIQELEARLKEVI